MAASSSVGDPPMFLRKVYIFQSAPFGFDLGNGIGKNGCASGPIVTVVVPGSPAAKAGLYVSDIIKKVGPAEVASLSFDRLLELIRRSSERLELTVETNGYLFVQKDVLLTKVKDNKQVHRRFCMTPDLTRLQWRSYSLATISRRSNYIRLGDIIDVKAGYSARSFQRIIDRCVSAQERREKYPQDRCLTIIHSQYHEELNLIAPDAVTANCWVTVLKMLLLKSGKRHLEVVTFGAESSRDAWIREMFEMADKNRDGTLSINECANLMHRLNINMPNKKLKEIFHQVDRESTTSAGDGKLDRYEFVNFYKKISTRPEVGEMMLQFGETAASLPAGANAMDESVFTVSRLLNFFHREQRMPWMSEERVMDLITSYEPDPGRKSRLELGIDGFTRLMQSTYFDAFQSAHQEAVYQDMSHPLTHYFIATSHNTYLSQDQLRGPSEVEAYERAFLLGCKCVELDCWDGDDGEPIVYHGHTLTSKIKFRGIIEAVKSHGFLVSPYPVILSLEVHTSLEQQRRMADIMRSILGEMIYVETKISNDMPSPEVMLNRVLIKGKKLPPGADEVSEDDEAEEMDLGAKGAEADVTPKKKVSKKKKTTQKKRIKLDKGLSDLVSYIRGCHFHHFEDSYDKEDCDNVVSFSELAALEHLNDPNTAWKFAQRNKKQMTRTYPAGFRVTSSNYDPVPMWNGGAQLVALNYQTPCHEMNLNLGRFRDNGGSGYVLKPTFLRDPTIHFNPLNPKTFNPEDMCYLTIRVISAQCLPKPGMAKRGEIIDPFVTIEMRGVPSDEKTVRTHTIDNNGFNPRWDMSFGFRVQVPDLALVYFRIDDDDEVLHDFIAQSCIPLASLSEGYRHIHLRAKNDEVLRQATLFIHVSKSRTAEAIHLSELARDSLQLSEFTTLNRPALEENFRQVAPLLLQPREFNEKIQIAMTRFLAALGLSSDAAYGLAMDEFRSRIIALGGTLTTEEAMVPNTTLSTFRLVTNGLSADHVKNPSISNPLRTFEYLRSVIEDVMRIQVDQTKRISDCINALNAARASTEPKETKVLRAIDERVKALQEGSEDFSRSLNAIREMMRLTHEKIVAPAAARSSRHIESY